MSCEHCGRHAAVMVGMVGPRGEPWDLCARCWRDGLAKPKVDDAAPEPVKPPPPRERRSKAKDDAGSFDKHPNAPEERLPSIKGAHYVPDGENYW